MRTSFISSITLFSISCLVTYLGYAQNGPAVTGIFPIPESITVQRATDIQISFDEAILESSVTYETMYVYGRWSGPANGQYILENDRKTIRFVSEQPFMAGELVTVVLSKNLLNDLGEPMQSGYAWTFWIKTAPASLDLKQTAQLSTRRQKETFIRSYGAYAGDFNGDGYSDLMIPNEESNDIRIFLNNNTGGYDSFSTYPIPEGDTPSTNEGADFNRDGLIDFAVGNTGNNLVSVWMGGAHGQVSHAENVSAGDNIRGLCVLDLDSDGDIDIVTANRTGSDFGGNISLLINDGNGNFDAGETIEDIAQGETACAVADANGDGLQDVYIGAYGTDEIVLFLSDGQGGLLRTSSVPVQGNPWMLASGDVNGDGFADVVSANSRARSVSVALGDGAGGLAPAMHFLVGTFPLAIDLGDLDGDGDLDLVTSNFGSADYSILENNGQGIFTLHDTLPATSAASCTILHDRDNDGDLDITAIDELDDMIFLFENEVLSTSVEQYEYESLSIEVFPMPFTAELTFSIKLPHQSSVMLKIFDILGREVFQKSTTVSGNFQSQITWYGRDSNNAIVPPGIYLYSLSGDDVSHTGQIVKGSR